MNVKKAYARAGVDVDLGNRLKRGIQSLVRRTYGPQVLGKIGGFGGLFRANFPGMREPVLVASIDGVGTKLKIAFATDKHDTVGGGSRQPLRRRHYSSRRASTFLSRLHRLRETRAARFQTIAARASVVLVAGPVARSRKAALLATWKKGTMTNCQRPLGRNREP